MDCYLTEIEAAIEVTLDSAVSLRDGRGALRGWGNIEEHLFIPWSGRHPEGGDV